MNEPRRVVGFVVWSTATLLLTSLIAWFFRFTWTPLERINLISDVVTAPVVSDTTALNKQADSSGVNPQTALAPFELYHTPARVIGFHADSNQLALPNLTAKLHALRTTQKGKIRIAYFGDSMIEGDLMTQTLRELLQSNFGGGGVGFVPITSITSQFRQTVRADYSSGWTDLHFKQSSANTPLYLSGHAFLSSSDWVRFSDRTWADSTMLLQKYLFCSGDSVGSILVNGQQVSLPNTGSFHKILLSTDSERTLSVTATSQTPVLFGVSFESPNGIILDNYSFRGITGIELSKLSAEWLRSIHAQQPYDLIVFQYGVNLLFRPMDKDFRSYGRTMLPIVQRFKQQFPEADILIVSTADRAFRYQGKVSSAIGIDSLIKVQAEVAYNSGTAFYNQFATMGGTNSIVDWANRNPPWAGRDYVHPNSKGAAWLGEALFQAILREYRVYVRSLNK